MKRRELLMMLGGAALANTYSPSVAWGMDRVASGGRLRLSVPLGLTSFDPHDLASLDAKVFGSALFDTLYALDEQGRPYPTLAKALPEVTSAGLVVPLRAGLRTSADKVFDAKDAQYSFERARAGAAERKLSGFGKVRFVVPQTAPSAPNEKSPRPNGDDAVRLAVALAHSTTALTPRGFSPARPEGTGPFRARVSADSVVFERNPRAARGPAFLESIIARRALDLASALRAFEAGEADVGWLASGLHHARRKTTRFDAGPVGLILLETGQKLKAWGSAGIAQAVLDSVDLSALSALGVRPVSKVGARRSVNGAWQGPSSDVLVDASCPQLVAIARSLVEILGGAARGVRVVPTEASELARARLSGDFGLLLDFAQSDGNDHVEALLARAKATATSKEPLESITRRLKLGVVGALHIEGASLDSHAGVSSWQLGDVHVVR